MIRSFRRQVRYAVEAVFAYAAWSLFSLLPIEVASAFGGWVASAIGRHLKPSRIAHHNLCLAFPEKSEAEITAIVAAVWDNLGRTVGELPHLRQIAAERLEIIGGEHIAALRDDGASGILIGAHFGGWELSGPAAERLGLPVHVIYRAPNNPWIDRLLRKARGGTAESLITKGAEGARDAVRVLKTGGHLGMLVDQKMNDGIAVPFMGRDAMTAPAVARFAQKYGCPVVPWRIVRLPGVHFRGIIEPPIPFPNSGCQQEDIRLMMGRINLMVEAWVRAQPEQWLWLHRRWPK